MKTLRTRQGLVGHISKLLCLILSIGIVLMGFPVDHVFAQQISPGGGKPIEGQGLSEGSTPQLLRPQEGSRTEAECADIAKHLKYLNDPAHKQKLQKAYESVRKLENDLKNDVREADEEFKKQLWDQGKDFAKDLSLLGIRSSWVRLREMKALQAQGFPALGLDTPEYISELEKSREKWVGRWDALASLLEKGFEPGILIQDAKYLRGLKDVEKAAQATQKAQKDLSDKIAEYNKKIAKYNQMKQKERQEFKEGSLKTAGEQGLKLANLIGLTAGPLAELTFRVGYLDITLAANLFDTRDLSHAQVKESVNNMGDQLQRMELDRNMYQHQYRRDCQAKPEDKTVKEENGPPLQPGGTPFFGLGGGPSGQVPKGAPSVPQGPSGLSGSFDGGPGSTLGDKFKAQTTPTPSTSNTPQGPSSLSGSPEGENGPPLQPGGTSFFGLGGGPQGPVSQEGTPNAPQGPFGLSGSFDGGPGSTLGDTFNAGTTSESNFGSRTTPPRTGSYTAETPDPPPAPKSGLSTGAKVGIITGGAVALGGAIGLGLALKPQSPTNSSGGLDCRCFCSFSNQRCVSNSTCPSLGGVPAGCGISERCSQCTPLGQ